MLSIFNWSLIIDTLIFYYNYHQYGIIFYKFKIAYSTYAESKLTKNKRKFSF